MARQSKQGWIAVSFRIDPARLDAVDRLADQRDRTRTDIILAAIDSLLGAQGPLHNGGRKGGADGL